MLCNRETLGKILFVALSVGRTSAECCYTLTNTKLGVGQSTLDIAAQSSEGAAVSFHYNILFTFPVTTRTLGPPTSNGTMTCQQVPDPNIVQWNCKSEEQKVVFAKITAETPGNPNGNATLTISMQGEQCAQRTFCNPLSNRKGPDSSDPDVGMVDFAGIKIPERIFYPVLTGLILVILGMGFLVYTRTKRAKGGDIEKQEEEMTKSRNKPGWFGEKPKDDDDAKKAENFNAKTGLVKNINDKESRKMSSEYRKSLVYEGSRRKHRRSHTTGSTKETDAEDDKPLHSVKSQSRPKTAGPSNSEKRRHHRHKTEESNSGSDSDENDKRIVSRKRTSTPPVKKENLKNTTQSKPSSSSRNSNSERKRGSRRKPLVEL